MIKFVLLDYGISIGGIEVMLADFTKHLILRGYNVLFVVPSNTKSIYYELIGDNIDKLEYCEVDAMGANIYIPKSSSKYRKDREKIFQHIHVTDNVYVITCFFYTMQYAMDIFCKYPGNIKMLQIWSHPLEWIHRLIHKNDYVYHIKRNSLYYYQSNLLKLITLYKASYFISKSIFDFNNWYYNASIPTPENVWCAPVRYNKRNIYPVREKINSVFRVLWIGRFTYFKNDSIIYIYNILKKISFQFPNIHFTFNIVGDGSKTDRAYIKSRMKQSDVNINFYGAKTPEELYQFYDNNDIGISMGLSVKTMAAGGLPSILIDSIGGNYKGENNCNWIFDIDEGDAGDGMYYQMMGKPLKYRQKLEDILCDILYGKINLNEISIRCRDFVEENYDFIKKNDDFIKAAFSSNFMPNSIETFHYNYFKCLAHDLFICLKKRIK